METEYEMTDATEAKPTEADIKEALGDHLMGAFREGMDTGVYTNVMGMLALCDMGADSDEIKRNLIDMKEFLEPEIDPQVVAALNAAYNDAVQKKGV